MTLLLHCGGSEATISDLNAVPLPAKTDSYMPLPHGKLVELVETIFGDSLKAKMVKLQLGLNRKGQQLFGVASFDVDTLPGKGICKHGIAIGFRNSYDKSMSAGVAVGAQVFVCDNLCFSGDAVTILRKHTTHILPSLTRLFGEAAAKARAQYGDITADFRLMAATDYDDARAFSFLGRAYGEGILRAQQFTRAVAAWKEPTHEEFEAATLWRLYNAGTEGLKAANAQEAFTKYTGFHAAVMGEIPVAAPAEA
jgi:hypothetical protein